MDAKERIPRRDYSALDRPEVLELLFHPVRVNRTKPPAGWVDHDIPVGDGVTVAARFHLPAEKSAGNIIFFHGNGELAGDYDEAGARFVERGLGFIAADYRGYGWSSGAPSVTAMIGDCHAIFDYVTEQLAGEGRTGHLVVMGRSLGSAPALELAAFRQNDLAGAIIESGFANTRPVLRALGIDVDSLGITEAAGFGNLSKIRVITKPVLILHAQHDQIIPISEAADLHAECGAAGKELQMIPGADHNNILQVTGPMYYEVISRFVGRLGRPARRKKSGVR
ncbi:MAG: alpha/beta hydrolase [Desulfurivibrionaceae bacterium]|nr:alpha/beta hydrolase [Desulfobulbales bacterium]MDT8335811.1 alpha/beta hydrolase [Desulfurivibrionaceae bacterium]